MHVRYALALFALTLLFASPSEAKGRRTLAVLPMEWSPKVTRRGGLSAPDLTRDLFTRLVKTNKFDVVERERLGKILKEHNLGREGYTDTERFELGKLLGAEVLVFTEIRTWEFHESVKHVKLARQYIYTREVVVGIDLRIVSGKTGKVILAEKVRVDLRWETKARQELPSVIPKNMTSQIQTDAVQALLDKVLETFPMKVVMLKDGVVYVNYGAGTGLGEGQTFDLYELGEALTDPDTGETLGTANSRVGRIKITSVEERYAKAELIEGKAPRGAVCKQLKGDPKEWPPVERR